jgi:hypothetical protein
MVEHSRVDHVSAAFIAYKVLRLTRHIFDVEEVDARSPVSLVLLATLDCLGLQRC